jgi:hypothetical protein
VKANDNNKYKHIFLGIPPLTGSGGKSPSDGDKLPGLHSDRLKSTMGRRGGGAYVVAMAQVKRWNPEMLGE